MATTSTSPQPSSEIHQEIEALFSWNPPRLKHARLPSYLQRTPSTSTLPPEYYDKHLSDKLILREVKRLPSLVQDLANNVDAAVVTASGTLPPLEGFYTARQRDRDRSNLETIVTDEKAVADFYNATTARFCTPLASTLALHPKAPFSQWRSLVCWSQSGDSSCCTNIDGLLRFMGKGGDERLEAERTAIVDTMESETRRIFEELRERRTPLCTWQMRSTITGPLEVMVLVPRMGRFTWTHCEEVFSTTTRHQKKNFKIARTIMGPDARDPPWKFRDDSSVTSVDSVDRNEAVAVLPSATLTNVSLETPQQPGVRRSTRLAAISRSASSMPPPPPRASGHPPPTKSKEKGKGRGQEKGKGRKRERDDDGEADLHHLSAQILVQQAWAQAVRIDGTVIILHSGNYELVCLRHRESQTLYGSDVIEPPTCANPRYGKLHVGIYVAVMQDMIDRQKQLRAVSLLEPPGDYEDFIGGDIDNEDQYGPSSGTGHKDGRVHRVVSHGGGSRGEGSRVGSRVGNRVSRVARKSKFQGGVGRKGADVDELLAIEETMQVASNHNVVLIYLQYDVYNSPVPSSFLRSAPPIAVDPELSPLPFSPRAISTYAPEERLIIVLTSEIGQGATGIVHRGTLRTGTSGISVPLDVIVKLAFDSWQRECLRSEYEVYRSLKSKGVLKGIATPLGFFDNSEGGPCALVMLYAGPALVTEPKCVLSVSDRKSALSTLQSIHRAGILHGDIREENILVNDFGVTIIDFGHSKQCDDQEAKDREFAGLRYILRVRK